MSQTPQQQGTTLEILAPYLPYGIEVEYTEQVPIDEASDGSLIYEPTSIHQKLAGILAHGTAILLGNVDYFGEYDGDDEAPLSSLLPVLRPFSQLCEPLPDGTVPAVEVAKLVMQANRPEGRTPIASYGLPVLMQDGQVVSVNCHRDTSYTLELLVDTTWAVCTVYDFGIVYAHNMLAAHSYLRSKHFAVGLEPGQFIPKTSAAAPIDKNTAL